MSVTLPGEAEAWIDAYGRRLAENDDYAAAASGWGVEFDGDFVFEVLPDELYDGEPLALYIALEDGVVEETRLLSDPDDADHGFALRAGYADWKRLINGEIDVVPAVMSGTFDVDGSKLKAMRYQGALVEMGETATRVDTEFEL